MGNLLDILNEVDTSYKSDGTRSVRCGEYPTIHKDDIEAVSIIEPDLKQGPWIAGGAALRWYQGQPVGESDIDVFCANAHQAQAVIERIKSYGRYHVKHESENAVTINYNKKDSWTDSRTLQVITRRYFNSIEEVIDNFDITVCQIGTTGTEWILGKDTARDVRERNLRFIAPLMPDAVKRLTKYWVYGYRPVPETIEAIQNNPDSRWAFTLNEDYNNAF
jgi:hypothetical protein